MQIGFNRNLCINRMAERGNFKPLIHNYTTLSLFVARGVNFGQKIAKNDPPGHKQPHILAKTKNHQKPKFEFVVNTPGITYTKEQAIWSICVGCYKLSVEVAAPKKRYKKQKISIFWPDFGQFLPIFKKIMKSIKTIEIHPWSKFWIIWTIFRDFMVIFLPFLAHFPLLLTIGKMGVFSHDFPRVSLNIS